MLFRFAFGSLPSARGPPRPLRRTVIRFGTIAATDNARPCRLGQLLVPVLATGMVFAAEEVTISGPEHYTENRSWNEAGLGPTYQLIVTASVVPSDYPTLVFVERDGVRHPLSHLAQPLTPNLYAYWGQVESARTAAWRIVAERGEAKAAAVWTLPIAKPQQVPLALDVQVAGDGTTTRVTWSLPDLAGFDIDRVRVSVRGGKRMHGRFLSVRYISPELPPTATSFQIPSDVLVPGEPHVVQVALEDLEGGRLENRSLSFSEPYTPPR